jgi:crotonobetainyl-CoA:carnitine CoA-transferase CaiB-like acyl-CoA transferase
MTPAEDIFRNLVIIDLGVGMAPALVTKYLVEIGARVIRLEPAAGDTFYGVYPAYEVCQRGKEIRVEPATGLPELAALLATADLCDFSTSHTAQS